jgi:hypothetical protein
MREYTHWQTAISNIPYAAMTLLGAAVIAISFPGSTWALAGAAGFVLYGILGTVWFLLFICPYCTYYATRGCPCGYGIPAARLAPKGDRECFAAKFRRHIAVVFPLWIAPLVCAGIALTRGRSTLLLVLLAAYAVDAYLILPLVSKRHSCGDCPQRDTCPWMAPRARRGCEK